MEIVSEAPGVLFGHRRLSIIDLSPAGHQPMTDPDTGNWITFNGEIYNYLELRQELEGIGQVFRTRTDTEVILKAYAVWGAEGMARLRGIFAFGLWHAEARSLLLVRDQLGVKPMYYWKSDDALVFASEVRALLSSNLIPRRLDLEGLQSYLAYGSLQEPLTMIHGIASLLPGHTLSWRDGRIATTRYWRLPSPELVSNAASPDVYDQIKERLAEAVRLQLMADVPLGAFLSGGIDSTAVAALAQAASTRPLKTFSVVFDETEYDEREYSRKAARHIGTDHAELHLNGHSVVENLPHAMASVDQPSVDGLNTYFVSKVTREAGLTVALSGLGGDELFAGYDGYRKVLLAEKWGKRIARLPRSLRLGMSRSLFNLATREEVRKLGLLLRSPNDNYFFTRRLFHPGQIAELLQAQANVGDKVNSSSRFVQLGHETRGYDSINRASALELQTYMMSTLLRDTDQMSMAHALEVRVPLIDHTLVEYVLMIPGDVKIAPNEPKPLLTRALNGAIPNDCIYRPKRGFELPFAVWLKRSLQEEMRTVLFEGSRVTEGALCQKGLEAVHQQFCRGSLSWSRIWSLFVLIKWMDCHRMTM
jgi:asparagine synthase (glutamine-hydrolysing)